MVKYWMPENGDTICIAEEPHVVKFVKREPIIGQLGLNGEQSYKVWRTVSIPHAFRDGLQIGEEYIVQGTCMEQNIHYEWVYVDARSEYLKDLNISTIEIPLRYCKPKNIK